MGSPSLLKTAQELKSSTQGFSFSFFTCSAFSSSVFLCLFWCDAWCVYIHENFSTVTSQRAAAKKRTWTFGAIWGKSARVEYTFRTPCWSTFSYVTYDGWIIQISPSCSTCNLSNCLLKTEPGESDRSRPARETRSVQRRKSCHTWGARLNSFKVL